MTLGGNMDKHTEKIILLVFAFVFFCISTFMVEVQPGVVWYRRFSFVSAGLACWVLVDILFS
jgi:hypothetical protein